MRFKNLERFKVGGTDTNMKLAIPLPRTASGRVYRFSPNENAHPRLFLLGNSDKELPETPSPRMKQLPGQPMTVCPYSGVIQPDSEFTHPDDVTAAHELVANAAFNDVTEAFQDIFRDLERKTSRNKFVTIKAGAKSPSKPAPRFARNDLLRELVCDECRRDYGVFAISLFCPDCGAPNIHLHFARESKLVRDQTDLAKTIAPQQGELAYRLLGNAHEDVLTAFEAALKTVYRYKVEMRDGPSTDSKLAGNTFQNIDRVRKRFAELNFDPFAALSADEFAVLVLNIQKRHVIGHNLSVADAVFVEHATDARIGETVPLVSDDIMQFAAVAQIVIDHLDAWLANMCPPPKAPEVSMKAIALPPKKEVSPLHIGELSPLAIRIGLWIAKQSAEGLNDPISDDVLKAEFSSVSVDELGFSIAELTKDGYVSATAFIGARLPLIRPTTELFIAFDPHAVGSSPAADVVSLIDLALAKKNACNAQDLHTESGWPIRRFNPPFAYMLSRIDDRRISKGAMNYPATAFLLMDSDRVELKRFADRLRGK